MNPMVSLLPLTLGRPQWFPERRHIAFHYTDGPGEDSDLTGITGAWNQL